jgi:glycosyltransferase involved in cell wall biosynthesis
VPRVSVIIPTYNRADYLVEAINSVLAQTFQDFEVIVVDDGSTDDTYAAIANIGDPRVRYFYQTNAERSAARNRGAQETNGEYFVFLDSDDWLLPHMLQVCIDCLDRQDSVGLVACGYEYVDEHRNLIRRDKPWVNYPSIDVQSLLFRGLTAIHGVMIRRAWFERIDGFDPRYSGPEDMDFWFRLSIEGCPIVWEKAIVCQYRIHSLNSSRSVKQHYDAYFDVLDKLFACVDLPISVYERRAEVYGEVSLAEAGRLYAHGDNVEAQSKVCQAMRYVPAWQSEDNPRLLNAIIDWQKAVWIRNQDSFLNTVLKHLPEQLRFSPSWCKRLLLNTQKDRFYSAHIKDDAPTVRHLWVMIAARDPVWLLNRGGWSILLQSFGFVFNRHNEGVVQK